MQESHNLTDRENIEKELCEERFYFFVQCAWKQIDPAEYIKDWFHQDICEHCEAVNRGDILRLIINIPPRCLKSLICSVFYPVFVWINKPSEIFLTGSHSLSLAVRDAMKARTLMDSPWFRRFWGDRIKFKDDQNQKSKYYNTAMGLRQVFSMSSKFIGEGADQIIIDDAMNYDQALSKPVREGIIEMHNEGISTRFNSQQTGREIIIGQRLHEDDLPGYLLKNNKAFYHLCIPMRYEAKSINRYVNDQRTKEGEILTNTQTEKSLSALEKTMGSVAVSGQMQQNPTPRGGAIIKRSWFRYYTELPNVIRYVSSWDTAMTEKKESDYTVGGLFAECELGHYLVDMFREQVDFSSLLREFKNFYLKQPVSAALIENKASGIQLIQMLQNAGSSVQIPVLSINVSGDKVYRAQLASPMFEAGKIWLPEGKPWLKDIVDEISMFPRFKNDDIVDMFTQYVNWVNGNPIQSIGVV